MEASFSLGQEVIGWRQSTTTTGMTLHENLVVGQSAQANEWIVAGDDPALYMTITEIDSEIKKEAGE